MPHLNIHNFFNILLQLLSGVYIKIRSVGSIKERKLTLVQQNFILNEIRKHKEGKKNDLNLYDLY